MQGETEIAGSLAGAVRQGEVTVKEGCHPQQMLGESSIAAAISTFLPLSQGDREGADLGGPRCLGAALSDTSAVQNRHTHEHAIYSFTERTDINLLRCCTVLSLRMQVLVSRLLTSSRPLSKIISSASADS